MPSMVRWVIKASLAIYSTHGIYFYTRKVVSETLRRQLCSPFTIVEQMCFCKTILMESYKTERWIILMKRRRNKHETYVLYGVCTYGQLDIWSFNVTYGNAHPELLVSICHIPLLSFIHLKSVESRWQVTKFYSAWPAINFVPNGGININRSYVYQMIEFIPVQTIDVR